jgi:integrase
MVHTGKAITETAHAVALARETGLLTEAAASALLARYHLAANTRRSYAAALAHFAQWHVLRYGEVLALLRDPPAAVPSGVAIQWVLDHTATPEGMATSMPTSVDAALVAAGVKAQPGPLHFNSIAARIAALSSAHRLMGLASPRDASELRTVMSAAKKAALDAGQIRKSKTPLLRDALMRVLATCDDSAIGIRDRAILWFGWGSGGRRPEEVANARIDHLRVYPREVTGCDYEYLLYKGKTFRADAEVGARRKALAGIAADALTDHLARMAEAGIHDGPLFRAVTQRGGRTRYGGKPLDTRSLRRMVKRRAAEAGLPGDFAARSWRSGFVTTASREGFDLHDIMRATDHVRAETVFAHYEKPQEGLDSPIAQINRG